LAREDYPLLKGGHPVRRLVELGASFSEAGMKNLHEN
jgi:hypothetical protein